MDFGTTWTLDFTI